MKNFILWSVIVLLLGFMLVWNPPLAQADGQGIYSNKCAMCHGADGRGNGPAAAALSPPPADFNSSSFWKNTSKEKMRDTIENGHGQMPAFELSPSDINAVLKYLSQTFKPAS